MLIDKNDVQMEHAAIGLMTTLKRLGVDCGNVYFYQFEELVIEFNTRTKGYVYK